MPASLQAAIRDIHDFPKPGIVFKDITPLLSDPAIFSHSVELLAETVKDQKIDKVLGIDARGLIFGAPVALALKAGFIPLRKPGKLPWKTHSASYDLEYGSDSLEIHQDAIQPGDKIMLIDDLLATGGTASAAIQLISKLGGEIVCASFLIELNFLNGRQKLGSTKIHSILQY